MELLTQKLIIMGKFETLNATMHELKLTPKEILRHWIITKEIDGDTLEDIFCGLELDAANEPQVGYFAFAGGIFAPRLNVYPNFIGILAWLNPDSNAPIGERGLILIPEKQTGKWARHNGRIGANRKQDGIGNTEIMNTLSDGKYITFPAATFCSQYQGNGIEKGEGFLPAVSQLENIAQNAKAIKYAMSQIGCDFSGKLLSSTEYTSHYAYTVDVDTLEVSGISKIQDCDYYAILAF